QFVPSPILSFLSLVPSSPISTLFPYTTLFRSGPGLHLPGPGGWPPSGRTRRGPADGASLSAPGAAAREDGEGEGLSARRSRSPRSEEHTSELQSRENLVCRLLLEKKNDCLHNL